MSREILVLRSLLYLVEREQARLDKQGGPWDEDAEGRVLARQLRHELEMEEFVEQKTREMLDAARGEERVPVQDGKLKEKEKEKEHGGTGAEG